MRASSYNYSKDAKLRISIINKYWKLSTESTAYAKMIGKTEENNFSGFSLIDYHSFVTPPHNKGNLKPLTPLTDIKFKFNSCGKPRKMEDHPFCYKPHLNITLNLTVSLPVSIKSKIYFF